jgi:hypothetical protein
MALPPNGTAIGSVRVVNPGTADMALVLLDDYGREVYRTQDNEEAGRVITDIAMGLDFDNPEDTEFFLPMLRVAAHTWVTYHSQEIN